MIRILCQTASEERQEVREYRLMGLRRLKGKRVMDKDEIQCDRNKQTNIKTKTDKLEILKEEENTDSKLKGENACLLPKLS
jgi:hypothetical protein